MLKIKSQAERGVAPFRHVHFFVCDTFAAVEDYHEQVADWRIRFR